MKKNIFKIAALSVLLTFTNCNTDNRSNNDLETTTSSTNINSLKTSLQNFNKNYKFKVVSNSNIAAKKKWWQVVGQVTAIAAGDVGGAAGMVGSVQILAGVVGAATAGTGYAIVSGGAAIVGAVGGSYAAYCGTGGHCRGTFNATTPVGSSVVYDFPSQYDYLENFGVLHNNALQNVYMDENPKNELEWIENNIPRINEIDYIKLYNSEEFKTARNNVNAINVAYKNSGYDTSVLLNGLKDKEMISQNTYDILSLYFDATLRSQTFEDYKNITDFYTNTVISSNELSDIDKQSLLAAFSVSIQSYYYWLNIEE